MLLQRKAEGATILLSSHILSEVEAICDRVAIVDRGALIRQGALDDIIGAHVGYEIKFTGVEVQAVKQVQSLGVKVELISNEYRTFTGDEELSQRVVDIVRASGGRLRAFVPVTRTLEDVFLEVTGNRQEGTDPPIPANSR
jgi:ABC-2 type transport system ATP-binding protein